MNKRNRYLAIAGMACAVAMMSLAVSAINGFQRERPPKEQVVDSEHHL